MGEGSQEDQYLFNVKVSNDNSSEVFFSNFVVHIYKCYTANCTNCSFGTVDTEVCYTCQSGYTPVSNGTSCERDYGAVVFRIYMQVLGALMIFIGFFTLFFGRAQQPAWMNIEMIQFVLMLPLLVHGAPPSLLHIWRGMSFLSFDLEYLSFTQLPFWETDVLSWTNIPQLQLMFIQYGYNFGSAFRNCW